MKPSVTAARRACGLLLCAATFAPVVVAPSVAQPPAKAAAADPVQHAAFQWLRAELAGHGGVEGDAYRFEYALLLPRGQAPVRTVPRIDMDRDSRQQRAERYGAGGLRTQPVAVPAVMRRRPVGKTEGAVRFTLGQVRRAASGREAVVQGGYQFHSDDKRDGDNGAGAAIGWSLLLRREGSGWRVVEARQSYAAG